MKKITIFRIILAACWLGLAVAYGVLMFQGVQVDALCGFCPSALCASLYIDKIIQDLEKKEK